MVTEISRKLSPSVTLTFQIEPELRHHPHSRPHHNKFREKVYTTLITDVPNLMNQQTKRWVRFSEIRITSAILYTIFDKLKNNKGNKTKKKRNGCLVDAH